MKNTKVIVYRKCCGVRKSQIEISKNDDGTSTSECLNCGKIKTSNKK
jgi:hypothetical protein